MTETNPRPVATTSPSAIAALGLGVLGLVLTWLLGVGVFISALAIGVGIISRRQIARSNGHLKGSGQATAGIVLGVLAVVVVVVALTVHAATS